MSLNTNLSASENPFEEDDLLRRNFLFELTQTQNPEELINQKEDVRKALEQFSWFTCPTERNCLYRNLLTDRLMNYLTKYLKE